MSEDLSHDAHLRAALRHAPDHALAPPAGVSQTILNAARQVHKPARPAATPAPAVRITVAPPRAIAWLRQWFASPRLAGGLATGLVAALGLGLWIDLGREPLIDRTPVEAAKEIRSSEATPAAPPAVGSGGASADELRRAPQQSAPPAAPVDGSSTKRRTDATAAISERRVDPTLRQAPAARPAPPERREERVMPESEGGLAKVAPPAAPAPAAVPAPAPRFEPAPAVAETARAQAEATPAAPMATAPGATDSQQRDAAMRSDMRMSSAAGRAAAVAGARASAVDSAADAVATASPAFALLRRTRSEMASGLARWTWMPPGKAAIVPLDEAAHEWLARVAQASRARWSDTTERASPGEALEVRWWRDDWPQATLRIEADGLRWIEHSGRIRHAPLDPATLQRLRNP